MFSTGVQGGLIASVQQGQSQQSNEMREGEMRVCHTRGSGETGYLSEKTCRERCCLLLNKPTC